MFVVLHFTSINRKICSVPGKSLVLAAKTKEMLLWQDNIPASKAGKMAGFENVAHLVS